MKPQPVVFVWRSVLVMNNDGARTMAMVPVARYHNVAARQFGEDGTEHVLEPASTRSKASHDQYFAALSEIYESLPDSVAKNFPTLDHFRAYCLIEEGFCEQELYRFENKAEATHFALSLRKREPHARITQRDSIVEVRYPESQSYAAMSKARFEDSKRKVLDLAASYVGVTRTEAQH
jgi:hypothetical protein